MGMAAVQQVFDGSLAQVAIEGAYDATKINRGKHTGQFNLGSGPVDKFIGPSPLGVANLGESGLAIPSAFLHPIKIAEDLFWIFGADAFTALATRRVQLWTWVPSTNTYTFIGAITVNFPTVTNHQVRGFRAVLENYITGTVGVSGTAVSGAGTAWNTDRLSVGSRIGFGSTDPNEITTWYEIAAIGSDTGLTLLSSAPTVTAGTAYVIQDLMIVQATTNATVTNGGLFVTKGLQFADFQNPAKTILAATTTDRQKLTYWLRDAAVITNDVIGGCALGYRTNWTDQYVYSTEGNGGSLVIYRYNIRAALTPVAGAFTLTGTDIVITGAQLVSGAVSQANNGRVATLQHGAGSGVESLYLFTTTRILRVPLSAVVAASTTFVADSMSELPPGGLNTNAVAASFQSFDIAGSLDKIVIMGSNSGGSVYITDYYTGGQQFDRRAGCITSQIASAVRDTDSPIFVHLVSANSPSVWVEDGWLFWGYSQGTATLTSAVTAYPLAADLMYQADVNNRIICPKIVLGATPAKLYRALVNAVQNLGDDTMGVAPDMYRLQVRTSGIDDNTGAWTDVPQTGDLSGLGTPSSIQFAFQFRTAGVIMLPARVLSMALIYETEDALPSQYDWNFGDSDKDLGAFGFTQTALFGNLTEHTINIYRADTSVLVLTQSSGSTTNGAFQFHNGTTWAAGLGSNAVGTRRRFLPSGSLPGGVALYAKLTVA